MGKERLYRIDNIRFLLIFFVLFGHFLEQVPEASGLYRVIYSFHMPAFIFVTGYFAVYDRKKIFSNLIWPYFLFQSLYLVFEANVTEPSKLLEPQYMYPYWHLWYLLTIICMELMIPLFETKDRGKQIVILAISVAGALLAPFEPHLGYCMSSLRTISFLPFFLAGYYAGHGCGRLVLNERKKVRLLFVCGAGVLVSVLVTCFHDSFTKEVFFAVFSYSADSYTPWIRLCVMFMAACWIGFLFLFIPNRKVRWISEIGKNTYPVFVLHGFVLALVRKYEIISWDFWSNIGFAFGISLLLLFLLGNRYVAAAFQRLFTGKWIILLMKKLHLAVANSITVEVQYENEKE